MVSEGDKRRCAAVAECGTVKSDVGSKDGRSDALRRLSSSALYASNLKFKVNFVDLNAHMYHLLKGLHEYLTRYVS